jgi:type II secretory pathway component PulF
VYSVFSGLGDYINPRNSMNLLYDELNTLNPAFKLGTFENITFAVQMGWIAVTIQAIVLAMVVWVSRQRMKAKKFAWWIPVLGAVISNALSTACIFIALFSDPGFQEGINSLINAGK